MSEPVNIMGVVAFPNEDGKRDCRFIDPHYNELFTVPDGGNVVLTYIDGTKKVLPCTYIDDYHVKVGNGVYHICEFAECMHERGTVYQPEHPNGKEKYGIYEIYQISDLKTAEYLFESYDRAKGKIKLTDYRRAYAGMLPEKSRLDDIFMQHSYCTAISWEDALPGDLVFYPGDEHVGIVGGRDEAGNLLIIHCASSANGTVVTGVSGFAAIARPLYYSSH